MDESIGYIEVIEKYKLNSFDESLISKFSERLADKPELVSGSSEVCVMFGLLHHVKSVSPSPAIIFYTDGSAYGYFKQDMELDEFGPTQSVNCSFCGIEKTPVVSMTNRTTTKKLVGSEIPDNISLYEPNQPMVFQLNYISSIVFLCEECFELFVEIRELVFEDNSEAVLSVLV